MNRGGEPGPDEGLRRALWAAMLNVDGTAIYVPEWAAGGVNAYFAAGGELDPALVEALIEAVLAEAKEAAGR